MISSAEREWMMGPALPGETWQAGPASPAAVYRVFDADGNLLYIGSTVSPGQRISQHSARADWWWQTARITLAWHPDEPAAREAEAAAILAEDPLYNVTGRAAHAGLA